MSATSDKNLGFFASLHVEINSIMERDPAAYSRLEVILCYPSFHAVLFYRLAHWLWSRKWKLLGRYISQLGRWFTGIEIHPAAKIGKNLFIDHGMGVVIGEASIIGDNVTLYHGVTLGGVAPSVNSASQRSVKRHPTIEDDVIIGSGAAILGPVIVGKCARVGSNAVVIKNVPPRTSVVGIPAHSVDNKAKKEVFTPYGIAADKWQKQSNADKQIKTLLQHIKKLEARIKKLENN